ncbi:MAG: hypothetical protein LBH03_03265 [Holophagales bacterium]|jgi:hypothetical protein|nr:hypothetical protein [Holophagales bacterium]
MKGTKIFGLAALSALAVTVGCTMALLPFIPQKPLPPGTFQMQFTRKIVGPVDLTINGVRVPVTQKNKKAQVLIVSGLSQGKHTYFIASHLDIIGPDFGEFEMDSDKGVFQVHFAQKLKATLYDTGETLAPKPEGISGVTAVLE